MPSRPLDEKNASAIEQAKTLETVPWCEDYEKMISGMLYSCEAPELKAGRVRARRLAAQYNAFWPEEQTMEALEQQRLALIRGLFGKVGDGSFIEPSLQVDYGCNISIGRSFYANFNTVILDCARVTIGDRVFFGTGVSLITATHETGIQSRRDNIEYAKPITIGDDCWLGTNVTVLPGVNIGRGCTIGSGSVVTKDVPEYSVCMGVPAKVTQTVAPE